ncbi:hypothetical protein SK128_022631, partial [Halocaridina rubra]
ITIPKASNLRSSVLGTGTVGMESSPNDWSNHNRLLQESISNSIDPGLKPAQNKTDSLTESQYLAQTFT